MLDFSDPIQVALVCGAVALPVGVVTGLAVRPGHRQRPATVDRESRQPSTAGDAGRTSHRPSRSDPEWRAWLSAAVRSLGARPIWEGEHIAQPLIARATEGWLEIELDEPDSMAAPVPWVDVGGGRRWRLMRSTPIGQLPFAELDRPMPAMVAIGDGLLVNLEGLGLLTLDGEIDGAMDLVRSIVHQLLPAGAHGSVDVRSTFAVTGLVASGLIRRCSPADLMAELPGWLDGVEEELRDRSAHSAYGHRLSAADPIRTIVVITDPVGARDMPTVIEAASERRLPLGVIIVGGFAERDEAAIVLSGPETATLEPWGIEFAATHRPATTGRRLAELLDGCGPRAKRRRPRRTTVTPVNRTANRQVHHPHRPRRRSVSAHQAVAIGPEPEHWPHGPRTCSAAVAASAGDRDRSEVMASGITPAGLPGPPPAPPPAASTRPHPAAPTSAATRPHPAAPPAASTRPHPAAPTSAATEAELEIRVLGGIEVVGLDEDPTSQQLSLLTFLACHPGATRDAIVDALWDGQTISESRFPNLLAETRGRVGRDHLPDANESRYRLNGIGTDLDRFEQLVKQATGAEEQPAASLLRSALDLVRGVPFTPPARRFWSWVGDHGHVAARVESAIADAAARLARFEQHAGRLDEARWACERGLAASPADRALVTILTEVYVSLGKPALAARLVETWEERIERLDR